MLDYRHTSGQRTGSAIGIARDTLGANVFVECYRHGIQYYTDGAARLPIR